MNQVMFGLILVFCILGSIYGLGLAFQEWTNQYENALGIRLSVFGGVTILLSIALHRLLRARETSNKILLTKKSTEPGFISIEELAIHFAGGVVEGFEKDDPQTQMDV